MATLAQSSCSLSFPLSWVTKSGLFCSRCQKFDSNMDPYSQASLHTVALQLETIVYTLLNTVNIATNSSTKFSTVLGVLLWQFDSFTIQASRKCLNRISLHNTLEEWFDDTRMVVSIDVINATTAPIMLHRLRDVKHVHRGPVQLGLHPKEDLQSLTNACAIFFNVTMAINNSASFNTVGGVLHWHSGDFPYSGKCSSLKKLISLLNVLRNGLTTPGWWSTST
jgi:hypothetical protein